MKPETNHDLAGRLHLQAVHLELTEAMKNVLHEKLAVLLRHNDYIVRINVRLQRDQTLGTESHYTATGQIEIGGPDLVASADGKDAYELIDVLVDKLDRQLERRHGKRKDRRNHPNPPDLDAALPKSPGQDAAE
jgi:putative sigma-54 modulation protein